MLGQLVGSCWNEGKMRHGWKSCKSILGSLAKQGNCEVQTAARLGLINRISTTHIKEGQPRGNYCENQKEKQVHVCGELDFSCPKDRTVPPNSPAQGMQEDQFCAHPHLPPCSCSLARVAFVRAAPAVPCSPLNEHSAKSCRHTTPAAAPPEGKRKGELGLEQELTQKHQDTTKVGLRLPGHQVHCQCRAPCPNRAPTHPLPAAACTR